jgi:hypothetical protein
MIELRWAVPEGTTTERPRLQYRQRGEWPAAWSDWFTVPYAVVNDIDAPANASTTGGVLITSAIAGVPVCPTCGGTKVDPGGLPICRTCGAPPADGAKQ